MRCAKIVENTKLTVFVDLTEMHALVCVDNVVSDEREGALEELLLRLVSYVALSGRQVPVREERLIHTLIRTIVPLLTIC